MKPGFLYILSNKPDGVLYIGVTSNLPERISQHKQNAVPGFTQKYNVKSLVYYECFDDILDAIEREKRLKKWRRRWKVALIEDFNPDWKDLSWEL